MSILNLGLQCVGLARSEMSAEFEAVVKKCGGLAELRQQVVSYKNDSLSPVKARLHTLFCRLQLHTKSFEIYHSATDDEMSEFWSTLLTLDSTLREEHIERTISASMQKLLNSYHIVANVRIIHLIF